MTSTDLINGNVFIFENEDKSHGVEVSFSEILDKFGVWHNGKLFTFKTMKAVQNKIDILCKKFKVSLIEIE